jgi:hypothetical protein
MPSKSGTNCNPVIRDVFGAMRDILSIIGIITEVERIRFDTLPVSASVVRGYTIYLW